MGARGNEHAFERGTIGGVTVGPTASTLLAANVQRRYAALVNTGEVDEYLALGTAAESGKGLCLKAGGGAFELNAVNLFHGAVSAITATGTSLVTTQEGM